MFVGGEVLWLHFAVGSYVHFVVLSKQKFETRPSTRYRTVPYPRYHRYAPIDLQKPAKCADKHNSFAFHALRSCMVFFFFFSFVANAQNNFPSVATSST
uniref:Uncharacterized protein n=1 Tax=Anopheles darlingi TaxID=43151 RepID=A0A2M4DFB0_ANODA